MDLNFFIDTNFTLIIGSIFMGIFILSHQQLERRTNGIFEAELLLCIIEMLVDALERQYAQGAVFSSWRILLSAIGYSIRPILIYLILLLSLRDGSSLKKRVLLAVPAAINVGLAFSAFFTPIVYSYTETNEFVRGPLGYATHVILLFYMILIIGFALYNRNKKQKFETAIIISIVVVILASVVAEALSREINIGRTAIILGIIFYYMYFQSNTFTRKQQEQYEIMQTLSDTYIDVAYINMKDHSFDILRIDEAIQENIVHEKDLNKIFFNITESGVDGNDRAKVHDFLTLETMENRLEMDSLISCEYRDKKYGWCRINLSLAARQGAKNSGRVLCTVQCIDQEKVKELEMMQKAEEGRKALEHALLEQNQKQKIVRTLSSIYFTTIVIHLDTEIIEPLRFPEFATEYISRAGGGFRDILPVYCQYFVSEEYRPIVAEFLNLDDMKERLAKNKILTCEYHGIRMGWCRIVLVPVIEEGQDEITQAVFAVQDVDDEKKKMEAARFRAEHDELTGLFNRVKFNHMIEKLKGTGLPIAFVIFDIDQFKGVNDTYGHYIGDEIIRKVADLLKENFRAADIKVRLGGDEYVVILYHIRETQRNFIEEKIDQINNKLMYPTDGLPRASVSAGIAFSTAGYSEKLYEEADSMLYEEKKKKHPVL